MLRNKKSLISRATSGFVAFSLTAMTVVSPFSTVFSYAKENWAKLSYQQVEKDDVEIYIQSESESFAPGETVSLKIYVQNNTEETLTNATLSFTDKKETICDHEFVLDAADETVINENGNVANITIAPGETFEVELEGTIDESLSLDKKRTVSFFFLAKDSAENAIAKRVEYDFTTGFVTFLPVEFAEDSEFEQGESGSMTFRIALDQTDVFFDVSDSDVEIASDSNSDVATDSDAIIASDSNADVETGSNTIIASDSDSDIASGSDTTEYVKNLTGISYVLKNYGVEFENVQLTEVQAIQTMNGMLEVEATVGFQVAEDAEEGNHFGVASAAVKVGSKTYDVSQAFEYTVVEAKAKLTAEQMAEVERVIAMINKMPEPDEIQAKVEAYCAAEDWDGYAAYAQEIAKLAWPAYNAYMALSSEQQELVTNIDRLMDSSWFWSVTTLEETVEDNSPYFTAVWTVDKALDNTNPILKIYCKDEDGNDLLSRRYNDGTCVKNLGNVVNNGNTPVTTYATKALDEAKVLAKFKKAEIMVNGQPIEVANISFNDEESNKTGAMGWIYSTEEDYGTWVAWDDGDDLTEENKNPVMSVTFIYETFIEENDINSNINVTLFDYGSSINGDTNGLDFFDGGGVTNFLGHTLLDGKQSKNDNGGGNAKVMEKTLDTYNYPAYAQGTGTKSLEYMFSENLDPSNDEYIAHTLRNSATYNESTGFSTPYATKRFTMDGDGGLFQIDKDGYYVYDCSENAAYFNGTRFELYDALIAPGHRYAQTVPTNNYWFNFLPFDQPYEISTADAKTHDKTGKDVYFTYYDGIVTESTKNTGNMSKETVTNLWFGMTMDFSFRMPKSGQMDEKDMIFEFSGDDDVWVYIDDVLVLDIGGTHGRMDGSINFATGDVEYTRAQRSADEAGSEQNGITVTVNKNDEGKVTSATVKTTLAALFRDALEQGDSRLETLDGNTFKDYTNHTLKFYYTERGGNISFCKLKFNMPILPPNSLDVTKKVENEGGYNLTDEETYSFKVMKVDEETKLPSDELFIKEGTSYTIYDQDGNITGTNEVGEDGIFTLEDGETARFTNMLGYHTDGSTEYVVQEVDTDLDIYDVFYSVNYTDEVQRDTTKELSAENTQSVVFTNKVKPGDIIIEKNVNRADGVDATGTNFQFKLITTSKVLINSTIEGSLQLVTDSNGAQANATQQKIAFNEDGEAMVSVPAGYALSIEDIPAGVEIKVQEVNYSGYSVQMSVDDGELSVIDFVEIDIPCNDEVYVKCVNSTGTVLPATGGAGTTPYRMGGLLTILLAAGYLLISEKVLRRKEEKISDR